MSDEKRLPCGWRFKLPRFCEGRKCETCVLNKKGQVKEKESEDMAGDAWGDNCEHCRNSYNGCD